ncbi:MAG: hypothetical protein LUO93_08830 [Methanomicrobiales archaeon]|nr:hypothetical protein [Methanomicrobiales archaeon]
MVVVEIYINRRGINTIEVPRQIEVVSGETLVLKFINRGGHPTHVSISATNSQLYTSFIQENLYVEDVLEYPIPMKEGPYAGVFDMEVVTGYGTKKTAFKVFVTKKCETPPEAPAKEKKERSKPGRLLPLAVMGLGVLFYLSWVFIRMNSLFETDLVNGIGFILVLGGAALAWYYRGSS